MNIGRESEFVEFKRSLSETKEGLASISAILNKHGKGTLYFGVKDNGDVIGQAIGKDTLNKLSRDIAGNVKPNFYYEINEKHTIEEKDFVEVTFYGNHTPYSAYGRYYLRFHDEDRQLDNDTLRKYFFDQRNDYSKWEKDNSGVSLDEVNYSLLDNFLEKARKKGRLNISDTDPKLILRKLGLLYDEDHLNNAGNVLFSKNGPVRLKLAIFAGTTRLTVLDLDVFEGNVFECIEKGMSYYSSNINWRAEFTGDIRRTEKPEIPLTAVREILVNAFCHGDYNSTTDFELVIYSNRVCIYSPGHFPKPYTPEMFANDGLEPIPFNGLINNVLYRDGTIEQFSTGFERAFAACKEDKVLYIYEETPNGFRFTFFRTQRLESGGYIAEDADPFGRGYNNYTQDLREYAQDDTQGWSSNTQAPRGNTQGSTQDNVQNCDSYTQVRSNDTRGRKESTQKNTQADIKGNIGSGYGNQVLSNLEKSIVDQLRSNPRLSQSGLAEILDINVNTLKAAIRRMTKQGLLSREGTSQKGYWVVHLDHQKN